MRRSRVLPFLIIFCLFISYSFSFAQSVSVEGLLDSAVALASKGDNKGTADALSKGATALESEAAGSSGDLKSKLLGQVGTLKNLIPLASTGKLQTGVLGKAVNAVKMLIGANRISSLLGKGDSGLLGKASSLTSSLGLIKTGSAILGADNQNKLGGLIGEATKVVGGLDKKGIAGQVAAKASAGQLGNIVKLVGSAL